MSAVPVGDENVATGAELDVGPDFGPPSDTLTPTFSAWAEAGQLETLGGEGMAIGPTLFGGSRLIFWALALPLLGFAFAMPLLVEEWTPKLVALIAPLSVGSLLLLLALADPARFRWAGRTVAAMVFLAYVAYAIDAWFFTSAPFRVFESSAKASPRNALLGLVFIGMPALIYAATGRFTLRKESPDAATEDEEQG